MKNYYIVYNNVIVDSLIIEDISELIPEEGYSFVEFADNIPGIGSTFVDGHWIPREIPNILE